jgi:hypothetical protein
MARTKKTHGFSLSDAAYKNIDDAARELRMTRSAYVELASAIWKDRVFAMQTGQKMEVDDD